jgi:hypothetical protein
MARAAKASATTAAGDPRPEGTTAAPASQPARACGGGAEAGAPMSKFFERSLLSC